MKIMLTWNQLIELYLFTDQTGQIDQRLKQSINDIFKFDRLTDDLLVGGGETPDILLTRAMSALCTLRRGIHEQASSQGLFEGDDESEYVSPPKGQKAVVLPRLVHSDVAPESDRLSAESVDSFVPDTIDEKRVTGLSLLKQRKKSLAEWKNTGESGATAIKSVTTPKLTEIKSKLAQAESAASVASSKESAMAKRMAKVFEEKKPLSPAPRVITKSAPTIPSESSGSSEDEDFNFTVEKVITQPVDDDVDEMEVEGEKEVTKKVLSIDSPETNSESSNESKKVMKTASVKTAERKPKSTSSSGDSDTSVEKKVTKKQTVDTLKVGRQAATVKRGKEMTKELAKPKLPDSSSDSESEKDTPSPVNERTVPIAVKNDSKQVPKSSSSESSSGESASEMETKVASKANVPLKSVDESKAKSSSSKESDNSIEKKNVTKKAPACKSGKQATKTKDDEGQKKTKQSETPKLPETSSDSESDEIVAPVTKRVKNADKTTPLNSLSSQSDVDKRTKSDKEDSYVSLRLPTPRKNNSQTSSSSSTVTSTKKRKQKLPDTPQKPERKELGARRLSTRESPQKPLAESTQKAPPAASSSSSSDDSSEEDASVYSSVKYKMVKPKKANDSNSVSNISNVSNNVKKANDSNNVSQPVVEQRAATVKRGKKTTKESAKPKTPDSSNVSLPVVEEPNANSTRSFMTRSPASDVSSIKSTSDIGRKVGRHLIPAKKGTHVKTPKKRLNSNSVTSTTKRAKKEKGTAKKSTHAKKPKK